MSLNTSSPAPGRFKPAWIILALLAVVLLAFGGCQFLKPKEPKEPYRLAAVEQGPITKSVSASGTMQALVTVEVGSQISGQIKKVLVDFNDRVKAGQVMAILDPQTYQTRVAQGQADISAGQAAVRQAQAQAAQARADFNRKKTLVGKGIYSPSTLDLAEAAYTTANANVQAARARVAQSQAALRSTQVDLSRTRIIAPIDGLVVDREIEPGQTVAASLQAPVLFRIAQDLSKVEVNISVDEADIGQVQEGQTVRFTVDAFPDDNFEGVVTQVRKQPVTEQNVVAYTVMAEADNPQGKLLPGMTANADIVILHKENVLKVPAAALRWSPPSANAAPRPRGFGGGPPGGGPVIIGGPPGGGGGPRPSGAQRGMMGGQRLIQQLDLTPDQQKNWAPIEADLRSKMAAAFASAGGDREAIRKQVRQNMAEALAKLEPILTADQKQKLTVLRATMAQGRADRAGFTSGVVYVLRDKKPEPVVVRIGVTDGAFTEIRGQLKAGDQVITGGGPKPKIKARSPFAGPGGGPGGGARVRM